jgi:hypothetical protein
MLPIAKSEMLKGWKIIKSANTPSPMIMYSSFRAAAGDIPAPP